MNLSDDQAFIRFENIRKKFVGVTALDDVSLSIARGECHCLMGENGAGKSTLGKILAGIYKPDDGRIFIKGKEVKLASPADALKAGVGMVHQELAFCPELSVAENLCMGIYPRRLGLFLDRKSMRQRASELLARIGVTTMDLDRPMRELTTAQEQLVQIAAAVGTDARVIVFDEPTSSLSEVDAQHLLALIDDLKSRGVTIVYVSHRMPEVFRLGDRISVLRDGRYIGTLTRAETTQEKVVQMMIGRSVEAYFPQHLAGTQTGQVRLRVEGLSSPGRFQDVSLDVRAGEIVGLAGLVGSGRSELAQAIFGLDGAARGAITISGAPLRLGDVRQAKRLGLGLLPEDRKRQALVLGMSCLDNFTLAMLERLSRIGLLRHRVARDQAVRYFERLRVKTPTLTTPVGMLSGGNQQKVALAKWLGRECNVLIVDEPTRGVDIGAKAAIHQIIDELAASGIAIVMISSELPELINLATRILVMRQGRLVAEVDRAEASQEHLLRLMSNVRPAAMA
ncbi:MAG TPA: sugar ABC transporter ATP-binding protein [Tepidisphaeraceae bacterium]|nr:sugar ABC transporter ATP-binding protein [Tepidisphaeraceae bacterium]